MAFLPRDNFVRKIVDFLVDSFSVYALHLRFAYEVEVNIPSFLIGASGACACLRRRGYAQADAVLFLLQDSFSTFQVGISLFDLAPKNSASCN
jgi:hypothetical protein